jgi:hypothetical protein
VPFPASCAALPFPSLYLETALFLRDGISINNTLYFEKNNNWTGINIEPIKQVFEKLVINRPNDINLNCAVCNNDGETDYLLESRRRRVV